MDEILALEELFQELELVLPYAEDQDESRWDSTLESLENLVLYG